MEIRRIVTVHDKTGRAIIAQDQSAPRHHVFKTIKGLEFAFIWSTAPSFVPAPADRTVAAKSVLPTPGHANLLMVEFPPDSVMMQPQFDAEAAYIEQMQAMPGLAECFEPAVPGMHRTPTIDFAIVLKGEIWLDLGVEETLLTVGQTVIQNGTRHAWRNKSPATTTIAFFMLGTER